MTKEQFDKKVQELSKAMEDVEIFEYGQFDEGEDLFDDKACELFGEDFVYMRWDDQSDCFDTGAAFDTLLDTMKNLSDKGKKIENYYMGYMGADDILVIIVTYK